MRADDVYVLLNKRIKGVTSGIDHIEIDGQNLTFYFTDGSHATMYFPTPPKGTSIVDVKIRQVTTETGEEETHLICIMSDSTEIDAGELPGSKVSGTFNYEELFNQPKINGITLTGNKTTSDLGIDLSVKQDKLTPGDGIDLTNNVVKVDTDTIASVERLNSSISEVVTDYEDKIKTEKETRETEISKKQDILTPGDNITIVNNVISSTCEGTKNYNDLNNKPTINNVELSGNKSFDDLGLDLSGKQDKLTQGDGINITDNVIKVDTDTITTIEKLNSTISGIVSDYDNKIIAEKESRESEDNKKQDKLIPGTNIKIENNVISATGGGTGTSDYDDLDNKPSINGVTLQGDKTTDELDIYANVDYEYDEERKAIKFIPSDGGAPVLNSNFQISNEEGNTLEKKDDGYYAGQSRPGKSAYEIAKELGFEGTEFDWLEALRGETGNTGKDGMSAYQMAVELQGFEGTELEWLASLQGADGKGGTFELVLMNEQHSWRIKADDEGLVKWVHIGEDIILNESIKDFDIVQFVIDPADVLSGIQVVDFEVHDIVYNPTETFQTGGSRLDIIGTWVKGDGVNHSYGAYHTTMRGWFKDDVTFYVDSIGAPTTDEHDFRLNEIIGIDHLTEKHHDVDMVMSETSENAIANKVVKEYIDSKLNCDTEMSDESTNCVENRVVKRYIDQCIAGIGALGGSGSSGSSEVYSIYETPIGTWHNGKTIYRKVFPNNDALRSAGGGKLDYTKKYTNQFIQTATTLYKAGSNHVWEYDVSTHNGKTIHITSNIAGGASIQYSFLNENGASLGSVKGSTTAVKRTTTVPAGAVRLWVNSSLSYTPDVEIDVGEYSRVAEANVDEIIYYRIMKNDLDATDREYLNFSRGLGIQIHNDAPTVKYAIIEYTKI